MATSPTDSNPKLSARDRLVETAIHLFRETGIRATGIDTLLATAKVAKMSLYGHFKSKDDLVIETIEVQSHQLLAALKAGVAAAEPDLLFETLAVLEVVRGKILTPDFHGCEFIRALSEFPDPASPVNLAVVRHRQRLQGFLSELATQRSHPNPFEFAEEVSMVIDGTLVAGQATQSADAVDRAKRLVLGLFATSAASDSTEL